MGFFSKFKGSWKKSGSIGKLQQKIASITFDADKEEWLMEEYLDLCMTGEGVVHVMRNYGLSKEDLYQYYIQLSAAGLGQWIKGHYVSLSTITFFEPLLYLVEAKKREIAWGTIVANLLHYWEGAFSHGGLLAILEEQSPFLQQFQKSR